MSSPDVLGMVLSEAIICLEKSCIAYTVNRIPKRAGDENKVQRVIRQRNMEKGSKTELLIAYF